ncbi:MAG: hypothetical protein AAF467_14465 [Actinomycetota bacterium]
MQTSSPATPGVGRVVIDFAPTEPVTVDLQHELSCWLRRPSAAPVSRHPRRATPWRHPHTTSGSTWADPDFFAW